LIGGKRGGISSEGRILSYIKSKRRSEGEEYFWMEIWKGKKWRIWERNFVK